MSFRLNSACSFIKKHIDIFIPVFLLFICYLFLLCQAGHNPLIDVDETRYAAMAREILERHDWLTMYLNHDIFYEKPPLYFWMLAGSYLMFGKVSEFAARFPIALISSFSVLITYYFGKKVISRAFGLISSLILLSSVEFLILSRIAIIDIVVTTFIAATIYSGFMTYFCKEKNRKYFWWLAYIFSALAVLAKGLPGVFLPFGVLTVTSIITGNLKQMFKPVNILVGALIFFLVALPWHILMFQLHGMAFINMYFIKQHFARFLNTNEIGRVEPFYYFVPVLAAGFFPWILGFIGFLVNGIKDVFSKLKNTDDCLFTRIKMLFPCETNEKKFVTIVTTYFLFIFAFFSSSHTKLPTYILPLFPAVALLTGYYWHDFILNGKNKLGIKSGMLVLAIINLILSIAGPIVAFVLKSKITPDISSLIYVSAAWMFVMGIVFLVMISKKKTVLLFSSKVVFMLGIIFISVNYAFPVVYNGGENELVEYAKYTKNIENSKLITFNFGVRPSTLFYSDKKVYYIVPADYNQLKNAIASSKKAFTIVKNKQMAELTGNIKYDVIKKGHKYSLISNISFISK